MGFRTIDALDPSYDSLELAKQKGVYRNLFNVAITGEKLGIPQDSYDVVVLVGVAGPKHLPLEAFNEMIRLVKPGGYIVNLMRADYLDKCPEYAGQWEPMVQEHVKKGDWRLVERKRYPCHFYDREGFMEVFRVC
ncbi:hypothetical protein BaRGS_00013792 [Batillaria attramentaria]|uniref:Methyltransferase type 11 domain-containing protein n=1 Tax=Batillaria attramentaria TaxID=370345 RepID=A0ABD0L6L1_9CAEN